MKEISFEMRPRERPRLSLEQKVRLLARRYRAAEKRRVVKKKHSGKRVSLVSSFLGPDSGAAIGRSLLQPLLRQD